MSVLSLFLDLLYPKKCIGCGRLGLFICQKCLYSIDFFEFTICPYCGCSSLNGLTHISCKRHFGLDGLYALCNYGGITRKVIKKAKYANLPDCMREFVTSALHIKRDDVIKYLKLSKSFYLVPIPLHKTRLIMRGYNQAELIADKLSIMSGCHVAHIIKRVKNTKVQYSIQGNYKKRQNIQNAFVLSDEKKLFDKKKSILLIDDVWTSGSTLSEAAKLLKQNGFISVYGFVLACFNRAYMQA